MMVERIGHSEPGQEQTAGGGGGGNVVKAHTKARAI